MKLAVLLATIGLSLTIEAHAQPLGSLAEISVIDRETGAALSPHYYRGEYWIAGRPGAKYSIEIHNRLGERLLAVTSVDGVNVLSGETAAWDQAGYVFEPGERYQVTGWRKSDAEVAAFTFTESPNSYAERTGRPANVGVIGIALYRERQPQAWIYSRRSEDMSANRLTAPAASGRATPPAAAASATPPFAAAPREGAASAAPPFAAAPRAGAAFATPPSAASPFAAAPPAAAASAAPPSAAPPIGGAASAAPPFDAAPRAELAPKLGTGHGEREYSYVTHTQFARLEPQPNEVIRIRYDSLDNLLAMGVIRPERPWPPAVNPFPDAPTPGYVPDPPGG
jgi:hypothetical protein